MQLDEQYLPWLYALAAKPAEKNPNRTYWNLFRQLYRTEFVWFVPNDDNRVEDGRDFRYEFFDAMQVQDDGDPTWVGMGCSMLEMLLGMSRRLAFQTERSTRYWFWQLLDNLSLSQCTDQYYLETNCGNKIEDVLNQVIWRTYARNGRGGLFPLQRAKQDQRNVEIWYQMHAYLMERM